MKRTVNSCCVAFNPFTQQRQSLEHLVPRFYGTNVSNIPFHRKLLNILLIPFCVTQRLSIAEQLLKGVDHLDLGISYYRGRWVITNGLYITPYTVEDVLQVINMVSNVFPLTIGNKLITVTLRLDYSFCPKKDIRDLFDRYEDKMFRKGLVITKVEYSWKQNFFNWVMERFITRLLLGFFFLGL